MDRAVPYPVDYQLALERTLRIRLDAVRAASPEFGACLACGGVISFMEIAADPTRQTCRSCADKRRSAASA